MVTVSVMCFCVCRRCAIVGCYVTEDYFLEKEGVFLLIDLLEVRLGLLIVVWIFVGSWVTDPFPPRGKRKKNDVFPEYLMH